MTSHKSRLHKLEAQQPRKTTARFIVLSDGVYREREQILSEAEYNAIASDPANDVTLVEIVRVNNKPVSKLTSGDYSLTVGIDINQI
jgi:hypothetical protein